MRRYYPAALMLLGAVVFFPPYADSFLLDDYKHVEFIRTLAETPWRAYRVASPFWIGWYYRPVQHWLILACYLAFGVAPFGYYAVLLALHSINIALLTVAARAWRVGPWGVFVAGSLFAVSAIHHDVLGWISSISVAAAALFLLVAIVSYLRYLQEPHGQAYWLVVVFLCWLLALLSREESIALLLILPLLRLLYAAGTPLRREEQVAYALMLFISAAYAVAQGIRPTWTDRPHAGMVALWAGSVLQGKPFTFLALSALEILAPGWTVAVDAPYLVWLGVLILAGLLLWFWRGGRATRFGLLWALVLLAPTYLLIWLPAPILVPGRYLYLPWVGLALAGGATLSGTMQRSPALRLVTLGALLLLVGSQLPQVVREQRGAYTYTRTIQNIRWQMLALAPEPGKEARFFAYDLIPTADFVQSMATVWYDRPFKGPGGHLGRLQALGYATDEFYVLNYEDGQLYDLMPELREARTSYFLWSQEPLAQVEQPDGSTSPLDEGAFGGGSVVGPPDDRRYALFLHPPSPENGWASLSYEVTVPQGAVLRSAVFKEAGNVPGEDGMVFRVRAVTPDGSELVLYEEMSGGEAAVQSGWREASVELDDFAGMTLTLKLEVYAGANLLHDHGYWANPRIVVP